MKKKFINGMLVVAMIFAAMGTFVSCKDHDEEMYSELKELDGKMKQELLDQIATLKGELSEVDKAQKRCEANCSTFKAQIEVWQGEIALWQQMVIDNYVTKKEFNDTVNSINNRIINHEMRIAELEAAKIALEKQDSILAVDIANANKAIERVEREYQAADKELKDSLTAMILKVQSDLSLQILTLETNLNKQIEILQKNDSIFNVEMNDLKQTVAGHTTDIQKLQGDVATNAGLISALQSAVETINNTTIPGLQEQITKNKEAIEDLKGRVTTLETNYGKLVDETIPAIVADVDSVFRLAKNDSVRIDMLEKGLQELKEQHNKDNAALVLKIDSICGELNGIKENVAKVAEEAAANLAAAEKILNERIDKVVETLNTKVDQSVFDAKVIEIVEAYQAADQLLQDQIDDLADELDALKQAVEKNTNDIKDLTDKYDILADKLNEIDESLKNLITGILLQATENPVFGSFSLPMNVQSNVLMAYYGETGEYGIEFPSKYPRYYVNANEALSEKDIEMLGVTSYTEADGATIVGNAGKVYVTVNPSNVNFEGQTLPIVNSLDEESGIKLSPLKYSDKKLTFGYSRSAENGLYEADATLAAADVNKVSMKFDFNASDIKATVKDVLNPLNGVNITNAVNTVTDVLGQFNQKLDANALKASWTDASGVTRNVYSQYNLAATAVKPLSYAFLYDANYTSFPGFDRMRNIVGRVKDKISNKLKVILPEFSFDLDIDKIKEIKFDSININTDDINLDLTVTYKDTIETSVTIKIEDYIEIDVDTDVEIPNQTFEVEVPLNDVPVYDEHGVEVGRLNTIVKEEITVPGQVVKAHLKDNIPYNWTGVVPVEVPVDIEIPVDMTEFKKMINEIEGMEDDINGMLAGQQDNINDIINTINSYLEQLGDLTELEDKFAKIDDNIDDTADRIKNKIIQYLDKIENKLLAAINSANKALQPVMLVKTVDGFQRLSQTIYSPTRMSSSNVKFVPTSYTVEAIAPAYKKLVGVTNVYSMDRKKNAQDNGGELLSVLKDANAKAGVAEILEGDALVVNFTAKKGYIYEVVYAAVDFSGKTVAKKYYVTVK